MYRSVFMQSFSVSLHVHEVTFNNVVLDHGQVWCVISIDGAEGPVSTSALEAAQNLKFQYSVDIPFATETPNSSCLYVTVCSFSSQGEMIPLTRSKTSIPKLPLNGANAFKIPLMSVERPAKQIGSMIMSGIINPPVSDHQRV